jgi:hypothetical protein
MSTTKTFQRPRPKVSSTMTSETSIRPISPPKNMFQKETSISLSELPEDALIHGLDTRRSQTKLSGKQINIEDLTTNLENMRIDKKSPVEIQLKNPLTEEKLKRLKERESQRVTRDQPEISGREQRLKRLQAAASSERVERVPSGRTERVERVPSGRTERVERVPSGRTERVERVPSGRTERVERVPSDQSRLEKLKKLQESKRVSSTEKSKEVEKDKAPREVIEIPKVVSSRSTKEIKVLDDIPQKGSILESLRKNTSKASVYNPEASFNKSEAIKTKLETIEDKKLQTIKLPVSRESKLTITQFLSTIEQKKKIPTQEEANISVGKMEEDVVAPTQLIRKQKVPDEIDLNEEIVAPTKLIRKQKVVPDEIDSSRVKSSEKSSDIQELIQDLIKNKAKISSASSRGKDFYSLQELQEIRKKLKIPTAKSKEELVQKILERLAQEEKVEK